jgi:hypothetical protein
MPSRVAGCRVARRGWRFTALFLIAGLAVRAAALPEATWVQVVSESDTG